MKQQTGKSIRSQIMRPLFWVFGLLWLCIVLLLVSSAADRIESEVDLRKVSAQRALESNWEAYERNLEKGLGDEAESILRSNLSTGIVPELDGALVYLVWTADGGTVTTQMACGYGHEAGVDQGQRWYLTFDEGLDDAGQMALARWIMEHRFALGYTLYPQDHSRSDYGYADYRPDGTYARVTGIEQKGYTVSVQKIELIHPDGTSELMVETATQGEAPIVLELRYLQVTSGLLPAWNGRRHGYINMERCLQNFHAAHARLREDMKKDGLGSHLWAGTVSGAQRRYAYGEYQVMPYLLRTNWWLYLLLLAVVGGAGWLLSRSLSQKIALPVRDLCRQTAEGSCREDGPVRELNTLAAAINRDRAQIEGQLQRERDFTRAAAHELKTPLAVLRANAEAMGETGDAEKRKDHLAIVLDEADRMASLTGSLLEFSRLESGLSLQREKLELSALVEAVFDRLAISMAQKGLAVRRKLEEVWIEGDRAHLYTAVENLASNALRHSPPGSAVEVTLDEQEGMACITVYNEGELVDKADLSLLWEPFYRGSRSRSRESGGTGLGLAIVRAAALVHGGSCRVENRECGVAFSIQIPAVAPPEE